MQSALENLRILPLFLQEKCKEAVSGCRQLREIKCRVNRPLMLYTDEGEFLVTKQGKPFRAEDGVPTERCSEAYLLTGKEIEEILLHLCGYSLFAYEDDIKRGFFTVEGGHRVGVAGKVIMEKDGSVRNMKYISYLTIRFAHEVKDVSAPFFACLHETGELQNTLIIAPPGCGKTTLLRDLIRRVSDGSGMIPGRRVAVVDERSEIAGCYMGVPQNDVGSRTDVLYGCRKADGMMMLIRSMSPEVVAVDEIGGSDDIAALQTAACCGVHVLATVHGSSVEEVKKKSCMKAVFENRIFSRFIILKKDGGRFGWQEVLDGACKILM